MAEKKKFKSNLSETPLPEILKLIYQFKVSGVLSVRHQEIEKKVFLEDRFVTFASSNVDDDRLGEFLMHIGKIKQIDYDNSVEMLRKTGKRQGQIFVELGCLSPQELFWAVKAQVKDIVISLFHWTAGEVIFIPGDFVKEEKIKLRAPIHEIIIEGIKRIQNPRRLVEYIGGKNQVIGVAQDGLSRLEKANLSQEYYETFNMVDGKTTLENLARSSKRSGPETVKLIYALMVLDVLKRND